MKKDIQGKKNRRKVANTLRGLQGPYANSTGNNLEKKKELEIKNGAINRSERFEYTTAERNEGAESRRKIDVTSLRKLKSIDVLFGIGLWERYQRMRGRCANLIYRRF